MASKKRQDRQTILFRLDTANQAESELYDALQEIAEADGSSVHQAAKRISMTYRRAALQNPSINQNLAAQQAAGGTPPPAPTTLNASGQNKAIAIDFDVF